MAYETETKRYDDLYSEYEKKAKADAEKAKAQAKQNYNDKLKQAYISRMQDQRELEKNMARVGVRGGATETSNLKLATNYQNTRNDLNKQQTQAVQNIDTQTQDNIFAYKQANDSAKLSYIEQREAEERQAAQAQKEQGMSDERQNYAASLGSNYSVSSLQSMLNSTTEQWKKAIINERINYLNAHAKGY